MQFWDNESFPCLDVGKHIFKDKVTGSKYFSHLKKWNLTIPHFCYRQKWLTFSAFSVVNFLHWTENFDWRFEFICKYCPLCYLISLPTLFISIYPKCNFFLLHSRWPTGVHLESHPVEKSVSFSLINIAKKGHLEKTKIMFPIFYSTIHILFHTIINT